MTRFFYLTTRDIRPSTARGLRAVAPPSARACKNVERAVFSLSPASDAISERRRARPNSSAFRLAASTRRRGHAAAFFCISFHLFHVPEGQRGQKTKQRKKT